MTRCEIRGRPTRLRVSPERWRLVHRVGCQLAVSHGTSAAFDDMQPTELLLRGIRREGLIIRGHVGVQLVQPRGCAPSLRKPLPSTLHETVVLSLKVFVPGLAWQVRQVSASSESLAGADRAARVKEQVQNEHEDEQDR